MENVTKSEVDPNANVSKKDLLQKWFQDYFSQFRNSVLVTPPEERRSFDRTKLDYTEPISNQFEIFYDFGRQAAEIFGVETEGIQGKQRRLPEYDQEIHADYTGWVSNYGSDIKAGDRIPVSSERGYDFAYLENGRPIYLQRKQGRHSWQDERGDRLLYQVIWIDYKEAKMVKEFYEWLYHQPESQKEARQSAEAESVYVLTKVEEEKLTDEWVD